MDLLLRSRKGFTLIELLIVVGIVAIISTVLVAAINPAEMLRKARDSTRLSDMNTLSKALSLFEVDQSEAFMGTSSVMYVSLADSSSTCGNLGLPSLPSGWTYNCVTASRLYNIDGTGWIPVNFNTLSFSAPLSDLPVDPTNTTSSGFYYRYVAGSWELNSVFEASERRYGGSKSVVDGDGGDNAAVYEVGSSLTVSPLKDANLDGYWKFNEGSGTSYADASGNGNSGSVFISAPSWTSGKIGNALSFNGSNQAVSFADSATVDPVSTWTLAAWIQRSSTGNSHSILEKYDLTAGRGNYALRIGADNKAIAYVISGTSSANCGTTATTIQSGTWYHVAATFDASADTLKCYVNGVLEATNASATLEPFDSTVTAKIGCLGDSVGSCQGAFHGIIDDARIYDATK